MRHVIAVNRKPRTGGGGRDGRHLHQLSEGGQWAVRGPPQEVRVPGEFKAEVGKKSEARLDAGLVDAAVAEARKINEMHVADAKSRQIMSQLDAQAASVAGVLPGDGRRLNFGKSMASAAADMIMPPGTYGAKAVAAGGAVVVPQSFVADPVKLGQPPTSLLSVLPVQVQPSPQFAYLRQSVRTNAAAI